MSNLVPTPRTDKTGRTVIRHMRPETATSAKQNQTLPPVTLATSHDHAAITSKATQVITDVLGGLPQEKRENLHTALGTYSNATILRVQQHDWTRNEAAYFHAIITDGEWDGNTFVMWDEVKVNDYLAVSQALREREPDGIPALHHNSWGLYPELHPADNSHCSEERLSQLVALYTVIEHMIDQGEEPYLRDDRTNEVSVYLEPSPLRELIFNPGPNHTSEEVTSIITQRGITDVSQITALLDTMLDLDTPSLRNGVL